MPLLYSLVFGEGVINDATSVALLRAVQVRMATQSTRQVLGSQAQAGLQGSLQAQEAPTFHKCRQQPVGCSAVQHSAPTCRCLLWLQSLHLRCATNAPPASPSSSAAAQDS